MRKQKVAFSREANTKSLHLADEKTQILIIKMMSQRKANNNNSPADDPTQSLFIRLMTCNTPRLHSAFLYFHAQDYSGCRRVCTVGMWAPHKDFSIIS